MEKKGDYDCCLNIMKYLTYVYKPTGEINIFLWIYIIFFKKKSDVNIPRNTVW